MSDLNESNFLNNLQRSRTKMLRLAICGGITLASLTVTSTFFIQLSGGVIANGHIIPRGENVVLQHIDGGFVKDVFVENGDIVKLGDELIKFDDSELRGELDRLINLKLGLSIRIASTKAALQGYDEFKWSKLNLIAKKSKNNRLRPLNAEIDISQADGGSTDKFLSVRDGSAVNIDEYITKNASFKDILQRQRQALRADRAVVTSRIQQIQERISSSSQAQIVLRTQLKSITERSELIASEIEELAVLVNDRLVPRSRMTALQRERLEIQQRTEALQLEDTQLQGQIAIARKDLAGIGTEDANRLWTMLQTDTQELGNIEFNIQNIIMQLGRLDLISPVTGQVHELSVQNAGTVVQGGQVILQIVPATNLDEVSVQIDLANIDDVEIGTSTRLRFDTFKEYAAKELKGEILYISPDRSLDPVTNLPFYAARIGLDEQFKSEFATINPPAGAPVSVMIETKKRSMADYLLEPVKTAMKKSFTES